MYDAEFFYKHAGYSYDPKNETKEEGKRRGAKALAEAYAWAMANCVIEWREDDADRSWLKEGDNRPLFGCILSRLDEDREENGESESLWGIDLGPTGNGCDYYKKVVVAELALELRRKCEG